MDKKEIEKQKDKFNNKNSDNSKEEKKQVKNIPDSEIVPLNKSR